MPRARLAKRRDLAALAKQWDDVAAARHQQLRTGKDLSFSYVLAPTLLSLAKSANWESVLDAGCGSGLLTEQLADRARNVVGVDMSKKSIELATLSSSKRGNSVYVNASIEEFAAVHRRSFTLIVANMLLQGAPDLRETLRHLFDVLKPGGVLVTTIPHPFFWPRYWKYDRQPWFDYSKELAIVAPFRISTQRAPVGETTHFHRPLGTYVDAIGHSGLVLEQLVEPLPSRFAKRAFPRLWEFPRFVGMRCRRGG